MEFNAKYQDPTAISATARADYEDLWEIARRPGVSMAAAVAEVDGEIERRTRAHIAGLMPDEATQFIRIYHGEHNRLAAERFLSEAEYATGHPQTFGEEATTRTAVRATVWGSISALFRRFR